METMETKETYIEKRNSICQSCEHIIKQINVCGHCKCFIPIKIRVKGADCPLKKWVGE